MIDKKITNFIVKQKLILDDICKNIIEEIEKCEWEKHRWYTDARSDVESSYGEKELDICNKYPQYIAESIDVYLKKALVHYELVLEDLMKTFPKGFFELVNTFSRVRFNRYKSGTLMQPHYDHIYSLFDGDGGIPVLSAVGCLNNDYEGGEFVFFDDFKIELNAGEILMFPSNFMYPHRVAEVTSGSRYSFVSWGW